MDLAGLVGSLNKNDFDVGTGLVGAPACVLFLSLVEPLVFKHVQILRRVAEAKSGWIEQNYHF